MKIVVIKFGGTSVKDLFCMSNVVKIIKSYVNKGYKVVAVVSAAAGFTDEMINTINTALDSQPMIDKQKQEYDVVLSAGEQISAGLLAIMLQKEGILASSWLGWQLPIITNDQFSNARIMDIDADKLRNFFYANQVAVVAGFQGVCDNRITTLGRGGSDTSAAAIAAVLGVKECYIYTDVDGIYTVDPNIVPSAKKLDKIAYEEMLEIASLGAKVLHVRSVEIAMKHNIKLRVLSAFKNNPGTMLLNPNELIYEEEDIVEKHLITGITYTLNEASFTLKQVKALYGISAVFSPIAKANINVDMIVQTMSTDSNQIDITFTIPKTEINKAKEILEKNNNNIKYNNFIIKDNIAKVSIVGVGMISHSGIAYKMFRTLAEKHIKILAVTTSEIKVSVIIDQYYAELAVRSLHAAFNLNDNLESIKENSGIYNERIN